MKRTLPITLLLTTPAAAQDASMVQGFAEGFTFHSHFAANRRIDPDGAVVHWRDGGGNTHCEHRFEATVEERMMPAFEVTSEQLNTPCKWK